MRDVAALARVSLKTVSRVINGETTVAPELAARVNRAAATLDYRPNLTARSLRSSDGLIIVPTGDDQSYLANEQRAGLKLVFVDRPPRLLRADTVVSDNADGA